MVDREALFDWLEDDEDNFEFLTSSPKSNDKMLMLKYIDNSEELKQALSEIEISTNEDKIKFKEIFRDKIYQNHLASINEENLKIFLPYIDKSDADYQEILQNVFPKLSAETTELILPYVDKDNLEWKAALQKSLILADEDKKVEMLLPMVDLSKFNDKDKLKELLSETRNEKVATILLDMADSFAGEGFYTYREDLLFACTNNMLANGLFHKEFAEQCDNVDENNNTIKKENRNYNEETDSELMIINAPCGIVLMNNDRNSAKLAYINYYTIKFEYTPEKITLQDAHKAVDMMNGMSVIQINHATHSMCHGFEKGYMKEAKYREVGNILLDAMLTHNDRGISAHAERSLVGYWNSIKDKPEVWNDFKTVLEKHPQNPLCVEYLGYLNGEKQEDLKVRREKYKENPNMKYVEDVMVDIDGTLIQEGKLNVPLVTVMYNSDLDVNCVIYTGGEPERQRQVLLNAVEQYEKTLSEGDENHDVYRFKEALQSGLLKIYPKDAFMQSDICLARGAYDDIVPENQGIKSLISYGRLDWEAFTKLPKEQLIGADEVFEKYQQKQQKEQLASTITNKLKELKEKTKSENIEDIPHLKTQILREIAKDNVSPEKGVVNRKRSDADKKIIKAVMDKAIKGVGD